MLLAFCLTLERATCDQSPVLVPFQGRLLDAAGKPIPDGPKLILFQIFALPEEGSPIWAGELHRVTVNGGLVNVQLGSKNPLPSERADSPTRSFFDGPLYLQITVDADGNNSITAADPPLLPRQLIQPPPYAQRSARADFAVSATRAQDATTLQGFDWSWLLSDGAKSPENAFISPDRLKPGSLGPAQLGTGAVGPDKLFIRQYAYPGTNCPAGGVQFWSFEPPAWPTFRGGIFNPGPYFTVTSTAVDVWRTNAATFTSTGRPLCVQIVGWYYHSLVQYASSASQSEIQVDVYAMGSDQQRLRNIASYRSAKTLGGIPVDGTSTTQGSVSYLQIVAPLPPGTYQLSAFGRVWAVNGVAALSSLNGYNNPLEITLFEMH